MSDVEFYFLHFNNEKVIEGCCFPGPKSLKAAEEELELYCIKPFKENRGIRWESNHRPFRVQFSSKKWECFIAVSTRTRT
jgi:hypothetical protein